MTFPILSSLLVFFFSSRRRHTRCYRDWSSDVCSSDLHWTVAEAAGTGNGSLIRVGGQYDGKSNRFGVGSDGGPTGDWTNLDQDPRNAVRRSEERRVGRECRSGGSQGVVVVERRGRLSQ